MCYRDTLRNGHPAKSSSLDKVSLENSFPISHADNDKSYLQNNAVTAEGTPDASQTDTSQETADIHLPASSEADVTSTAFTSSAPEHTTNHTTLTDEPAVTNHSAPTSKLTPVQPPTSDLREEPQPATSEQSAVIKGQKLVQDLIRNSEMADGDLIQSEHMTGAAAAPQADANSLPNENQTIPLTDTESRNTISTAEIPHHPAVPLPEGRELEAPIDPAPSPAQIDEPPSGLADTLMSQSLKPDSPPAINPDLQSPVNQVTDGHGAEEVSTEANVPSGSLEQVDQSMENTPTSPAKIARRREEEDLDSQPAVKRPRTDGDKATNSEFKMPDRPEISTNVNGIRHSPTQHGYPQPATVPQQKYLLKILSNLKRQKDSLPFLHPVDPIALNIPNYPDTVKNPMDLSTLEAKEKNHEYPSIDAFIVDFEQIIRNTELFNGTDHSVTQSGYKMKSAFLRQMEKLPGPELAEPARADKKRKSSTYALEKPPAPERESRVSLSSTTKSPVTPATQTFAPNAQGVPLVRRNSTSDRPKREIKRTAKDLPYGNQKPKKKKYQTELKFCQHVLDEIHKPRYANIASPFLTPVDPVGLQIPTYLAIVKQPMDFGTIQNQLTQGEYENFKEFDQDARLVFANCYKFNPVGHPVHSLGKELEDIYSGVLRYKDSWIDRHAPASGPTSAGTTPEPSDDEEEEEEEEPDQNEILKLQQQIAAMSKQVELITQKKKSPPTASKKAKNAGKPEKKIQKKAAPPPSKTKSSARPSAKGGASSSTKPPFVTYEQKQDISNRINSLPEVKMGQALNIIRDNMPKLKVRPAFHNQIVSRCRLQNVLNLELDVCVRDCLPEVPLRYRALRMTNWSWTSMSWATMFCTNFFSLSASTHRRAKTLSARHRLQRPPPHRRARRTSL